MRGEGSRAPLPVDKQSLKFPFDNMLLDLRDVVRDVVDHIHVQVVGLRVELFREGLSHKKSHARSIDPRKISSCSHRS